MRALSLTQPWASLVALGAKTVETRSWSTRYRGPLAVCATKEPTRIDIGSPLGEICLAAGFYLLPKVPHGAIVAVVELARIDPAADWLTTVGRTTPGLAEQERRVGDFSGGRFAWTLHNVRALEEPIPVRGRQGLWTLPEDVAAALSKVLA